MEHKQIRSLKFQPQQYNQKFKLRLARHKGYVGELNWSETKFIGTHGIEKISRHLHYLACHAPKNIRLRWLSAWIRFIKHYKNI